LQEAVLKTLHKNRAGGVAQGEGPEVKPQEHRGLVQAQTLLVT
jgi:hypothetical protein